MKLFFLSFGRKCYRDANNDWRIGVKVFGLLLMLFLSTLAVGQDAREDVSSKGNLLFINHAVASRYRPELTDRVVAKHPDIDLARYPLISYTIDTTKIGYIDVGEVIPDILLDMPLKLINDPSGRRVTTLRELSDKEFLVLDFWAAWCKPCLESMLKWESLYTEIGNDIRVVGVHLDFDFRAVVEVNNRKWTLPQIIGTEGYLLNYYLMSQSIVGPSAWIRNGRLYGLSKTTVDKESYVWDVIHSPSMGLPEEAKFRINR